MTAERRSWVQTEALPALSVVLLGVLGLGFYVWQTRPAASQLAAVPIPAPAPLPAGPLGASIRLGRQLVARTPQLARGNVGGALSCADCHLRDGRQAYAAPLAGLSGAFPAWNRRAGRVITLAERINECFVRSENGRPLPATGRRMTAFLAYIAWLSRGVPAGDSVVGRGFAPLPRLAHAANARAGARVYHTHCASCHGGNGAGRPPMIPPLWGAQAYNQGAGMNHVRKMAAFVLRFMPLGQGGSLTAQQAADVSAYVHSQPHPPFPAKYARY